MIRIFVAVLFLLSSPVLLANSLESFFSKTEGLWELEKGNIVFYDQNGNAIDLVLTKLSTKTVRVSETEWKFDETYCSIGKTSTQESCTNTNYIYEILSDDLLLLKSPEGEANLLVIDSSAIHLTFKILDGISVSTTKCTFLDPQHMHQSGKTENSDGTSSLTSLTLKKI